MALRIWRRHDSHRRLLHPLAGFLPRSHGCPRHSRLLRELQHSGGSGFSDDEADRFEDELRHLGVLVYVSCSESAKISWACEVLRHTGAREASTLRETNSLSATAAA